MSAKPLSKSAQRVLAKGARAMLQAQADLPPAIIHILQVLLDRTSFPPAHVKWVEGGVRELLAKWERTEDLVQLRRDLGMNACKKRRKTLTMRRETAIVASIANAAVAGAANPKKAASDEHQADDREVQRALKTWGPVYLSRLELMKAQDQMTRAERAKIRRAIDHLRPRRRRSRDKN